MADKPSRNERIIRILASLMVIVFAAILVLRFSPWGSPEQEIVTTTQTSTQRDTSGDVERDVVPLTMQLPSGSVEIELWRDVAPAHVERITTLAAEGFYDGIVFHRVIDGFMAQTGDPTGTGSGGSDLPDLDAEFSNEPFMRGTLGMARTADPNSANSQFFITFDETSHLNGQYTVFGQVVSGMENVDAIKKGDQASNGLVTDPDAIVKMSVGE